MSLYLQLWFETCHVSFPLPSLPPPLLLLPFPSSPFHFLPSSPPLPSPFPSPHPLLCSFPLLYPLCFAFPSFATGEGRAQQGDPGVALFPSISITWQPASAPLENHSPQSRLGNQNQGLCPGWVCSVDRKEASSFYSHHLAACPGKFSSRLSYHRRKTSRRSQ